MVDCEDIRCKWRTINKSIVQGELGGDPFYMADYKQIRCTLWTVNRSVVHGGRLKKRCRILKRSMNNADCSLKYINVFTANQTKIIKSLSMFKREQ